MSDWYKRVPKKPIDNLRFRKFVLAKATNDPGLQSALIEACRQDVLFYFNTFVWTYDPRLENKAVPFITYKFQDEGILAIKEAIDEGKPMVIQKSRDMGASWMCVGVMDYFSQFVANCKFLMISRVADLVDKRGDSDCLFWKIDFIQKWLPSWMLNVETDINRRILGFEYLKTNSAVTGSSTTDASGIGGRATAVFVDEFSRFDPTDARMVKSGLADTSRCRIFNFTPSPEMGKSHPSYELVDQANKGHILSQRWYWMSHPEKAKGAYHVDTTTRAVTIIDKTYKFPADYKFQLDGEFENHSPWFDNERLERGNDRDIREMLEIDYEGASFSVFDPMLIKEYVLENCRPPDYEGDLLYDDVSGRPDTFVVFKGGPIKLWMPLDNCGRPPAVGYVAGTDVSLGQGATNSCISCGRIDTGEKVLEYATPFLKPDEFATKCVAICLWLASPGHHTLLSWERQGPGDTFGIQVVRLRYSHIYYKKDDSKLGHATKTPGWNPTASGAKLNLLSAYRTALSRRNFLNPSKEAMQECLEWVNTDKGPVHKATIHNHARSKSFSNNDPSGAALNHGDRVIGDALCHKMMVERGAGNTQSNPAKPKLVPGMFEYHIANETRRKFSAEELFPEWQGKRQW